MKKRILLLLLLICGLFLGGCSESLFELKMFPDGLVAAKKDSKWGYLDKDGKVVIDFLYDRAEAFYDGVTTVELNHLFYLINTKGERVIDKGYDLLIVEYDEKIIKFEENGKYGLMNFKGKILHEATFDEMYSFSEGLAMISVNDLYGYVNNKGKVVIEPTYVFAGEFACDRAYVSNDKIKLGYINSSGKVVIDFIYDYHMYGGGFGADIAWGEKDGKEVIIDRFGKIIMEANDTYEHLFIRLGDIVAKESEEKYHIFDKNGKELVDVSEYTKSYIEVFSKEYMAIDNGVDNVTIYDLKGNTIISSKDLEIVYDNVTKFGSDFTCKGLYIVEEVGDIEKVYIIKDKKVTTITLDEGVSFDDYCNDYLSVSKEGILALMNLKGELLTDFLFDSIDMVTDDGYFIVEIDKTFGAINTKGKIIIPVEYEEVYYLFLLNLNYYH